MTVMTESSLVLHLMIDPTSSVGRKGPIGSLFTTASMQSTRRCTTVGMSGLPCVSLALYLDSHSALVVSLGHRIASHFREPG